MRELTPSILDGFDLDAPPNVLTFTVVQPPAHGRLINGIYGTDTSRYKEMGASVLQRSLPVTSFTLQELRQGETPTPANGHELGNAHFLLPHLFLHLFLRSAGMKIVYMHDDTETLKDAVALQLTDGVHTVQGTAQVTVLPVNDEKPQLIKYKHS